jgi:hypothetical protein
MQLARGMALSVRLVGLEAGQVEDGSPPPGEGEVGVWVPNLRGAGRGSTSTDPSPRSRES